MLSERACCPFFSFALRSASPHATVQLEIRGAAHGAANDKELVAQTFAGALALIRPAGARA
jgi:hypothetical protein